ncbi:MAG: carboxypeptidase M32 [Actinobacteria bacterium]|nr:carboxypeptidase M32 [Actinomycetota bacterium]
MPETFDTLTTRLAEIQDLRKTGAILFWDQQTKMPGAGAAGRAEQLATLHRMAHELFVSEETGRLLEGLRSYEDSLDPASDEASLIRVTRQDYEKAARVPAELESELTRAASHGVQDWVTARETSDFARFLPALERNVELKLRYVECFEPQGERYDVLLDDYERGMTAAEVRTIFDRLKEELVPLIAEIAERDDPSLEEVTRGTFPVERQRELCHDVIRRFGMRPDSWRLDPTEHPFASGAGVDDIRLTTHYHDDTLEALFATMHEYGHGLYEHGVDPALDRTPLGSGVSLGLHESQSRMWENLVGRSRPFWRYLYPTLRETFPEQLGSVELERFLRAINRVHPSLIRIHADEVTYNMHVILRFELEQEIVNGRVELKDLPAEWNRRMHEYLGIEVPDDAHGVLQDVHWAGGGIGYFPTYSLGNVISVQIWERVREDLPGLEEGFERGEFAPLREWLGEHLHRYGRKFSPKETIIKVAGGPIDPEPYLRYLRAKHGADGSL